LAPSFSSSIDIEPSSGALTMNFPVDRAFAERFAADWIDAWNAHDLGRVLLHYVDDFEMSSPLIIQIADEPTGTLRG
jgi:hypothetical protein